VSDEFNIIINIINIIIFMNIIKFEINIITIGKKNRIDLKDEINYYYY
jgi:hypothetical protein